MKGINPSLALSRAVELLKQKSVQMIVRRAFKLLLALVKQALGFFFCNIFFCAIFVFAGEIELAYLLLRLLYKIKYRLAALHVSAVGIGLFILDIEKIGVAYVFRSRATSAPPQNSKSLYLVLYHITQYIATFFANILPNMTLSAR